MKPVLGRGLHLVFIATLIAGLGLAVQPVQPAHAATIDVTTNNDVIDANGGVCAGLLLAQLPGPDDLISLREAICAANTNAGTDTINFDDNYTITLTGAVGEDNNASGDLDIRDNLIINGTGAGLTIIDGGAIDRVFHVDPAGAGITVEISGVTIQNGDAGIGLGSGIFSWGTLTLDSSTVSGNHGIGTGGIANYGTLTLNDSTVTGNTTTAASGGGILNAGGATMTVTNSTISGNTTASMGGGIYNVGTLTLDSSTVGPNNTAGAVGGGIFNLNGGTLDVTNSTISGNTADWGGGIANGGTLTLTNSTVSGNTTDAFGNGGGIWNGGPLTATNSTISGNSADNDGGGIYNRTDGTLTLDSSTVSRNSANAGGGIYNDGATRLGNTVVAAQAAGVDCSAPVTSLGFNLDSDGTCGLGAGGDQTNPAPLLGPLADNGGPTQTHALLVGSSAIDTGYPACPATDQRGYLRNVGPCDTGAYEFGAQPPQPPQPSAPGGEDVSEGVVGPDGLTLGDGCAKIVVETDAYPVGSIVAFDSNPSPDNSKAFGDFRLDEVLFFRVWVKGPDGAPMTEFSPPLLVCAQPCRGGEGTTLFDWDETSRMWRAWPTFVPEYGWHCIDWYGNLVPPPPGDQTTSGDQTASGAASGAQTSAGAGQTSVVEAPAAVPQVASAPSIGLPETGTPPGGLGLARIAFGLMIGLSMICGGVMLGRRAS